MSDEEKDAVIGKAMSRYVEEKREAALLAGKIRNLAEGLKQLGLVLHDLPTSAAVEPLAGWQATKDSPMVNSQQIAAMLDEYHMRRQAVIELRKQLGELGIPEPDR